MGFYKPLKTIIASLFIVLSLISVGYLTSFAQTTPPSGETPPEGSNTGSNSEEYLRNIMNNTYAILYYVKNLPTYLDKITTLAMQWMQEDTSETTSKLQAMFTSISNAFVNDINMQNGLQRRILTDLFPDYNQNTLPYVNDLVYQTLIGQPYFPKDKDPRKKAEGKVPDIAYNYIQNASGMLVDHIIPDPGWIGRQHDKNNYQAYFNGAKAVSSYNAYILSNAYAESMQNNLFNNLQLQLISQASSPDWFKQVGGESIGYVLRQILLYQSQNFVLMSQLLQSQRQAVIAQTLTNTMLILGSLVNENSLLATAIRPPGR